MSSSNDSSKRRDDSYDAEETIAAIHHGDVDAVVVRGPSGPQIIMLQGADAPYHVLVEQMSDGALTLAPDNTILYANNRISDLLGAKSDTLIGRDFASLFVGDAPASDTEKSTQAKLKQPDGGTLPVAVWMKPMAIGGISGTLVTLTDLSAHYRAEQIANAERFARSILEQATDAIVVLSPDGRITHASWMAEQLAVGKPVGLKFSEAFPLHSENSSRAGVLARFSLENLETALATKPFHGVEVRLDHSGERSFLLSAGPLVDESKTSVGAIITLTDITERKRAEEQQTMLVAELNHRVKNILAIVQSVAMQTLRTSASLPVFNAAFSGRIQAVSIAHDILTQTRWIGAGLKEMLSAVLAPYGMEDGRIVLEGPPVMLAAQSVLPLSMIVHELATNASKYGALSNIKGSIEVTWNVTERKHRCVELKWVERNGPKVSVSTDKGFGTKLIERVTTYDLDGDAKLLFDADGLVCDLHFPLRTDTAPENIPASATAAH